MNETLVKLVMEKTGLDQMKAQLAITVVLGFVKDKLPPELAGPVDSIIGGGSAGAAGGIGGALGGLGGLVSGGADGKVDAGDVMGALGGLLKK
jgi:hypothetical protein